jgi:hypothetical protein
VIVWGRCRGGGRWFWAAHIVGGAAKHGWARNRDEAGRRANAAAVKLAGGVYASIRISDDVAEMKLAAVTAAKQAEAEAEGKERAAAGDDTANLYAIEYGYYDHVRHQWIHSKVVRLPITKRTPKRIYFLRSSEPSEYETGYVDRERVETDGWAYYHRFQKIYAEPPKLPDDRPFIPPPFRPEYPKAAAYTLADLKALKAAMAAAHPDKGGTDAAFIAARERYVTAKRLAGVR